EHVHHQLGAVREHPAFVKRAITARVRAQPQERSQQVTSYEAGPSTDHLAIVNELARRQCVFDAPGHHDRAVVLDMLGQRRFAYAFDRLAQARHSHPGGERGAESDVLDKGERGALTADTAMAHAAEMMVAIALERIHLRSGGLARGSNDCRA